MNRRRWLSRPASIRRGRFVRAWSPFLVLTLLIIAWGLQPVKEALNAAGMIQFGFPGLHNAILNQSGAPIAKIFKFNYLSAAGTAILLAGILSVPLTGLSPREGVQVFAGTLKQLRFPILTVASVLAFAYVLNDSGMTLTLADVLANTDLLFPFLRRCWVAGRFYHRIGYLGQRPVQ